MATLNFDSKDILPLLGGQKPAPVPAPDAQPPIPFVAPPVKLPVPAQAGFGPWINDPATQKKITDGITLPGQPLVPPAAVAAQTGAAAPGQFSGVAPLGGTPAAPASPFAGVTPMPGAAPPPAAAPAAAAPPPTQAADMAAHPDAYQNKNLVGQGWKRALMFGIPAALQSAAGGLTRGGDPTAGMKFIEEQAQHDAGVPAANSNIYDLRNIKPLRDMVAAQQGAATLQHTKAQTGDIANKSNQQLAVHGLKSVTDPATGVTTVVPDTDSPVYKANQDKDAKLQQQTELIGAQTDNTRAQQELRAAQTAFTNNKSDPNSLVSKQVQQRLDTAKKNASISAGKLSQSQLTYDARYLGTGRDGQALAGTMITDDGAPVGSAFSSNVRPTGTERNKADMASSADTQIADMKAIIQRNPTMFGPGYGQSTEFKKWIGGQSPDAQRFMSARTIAADHLAGTFGGRSEAALAALDAAAGQFKDNPEAALAGLDQLGGANKSFMEAGAVRTTGSKAAGAPSKGGAGNSADVLPAKAAAVLVEGQQHTFNNHQVWTKTNGKPVRIK
jgi:hypothetical protein